MTRYWVAQLQRILPEFMGSFYLYFVIVFLAELIFSYIILRFLMTLLKKALGKVAEKKMRGNRLLTVKTLIGNITKYIMWIALFLLGIYFLNLGGIVTTILAAAGIGTLVIGLASQDLIKDMIGGITILSEARMLIGDEVEIGAFKGVVENIKIRTTTLRTDNGIVILPNSRIYEIRNLSRNNNK